MSRLSLAPTVQEARAASRVLRAALRSDHPIVHRVVCEALNECRPAEALAFASALEAALLAEGAMGRSVPRAAAQADGSPLDPRD